MRICVLAEFYNPYVIGGAELAIEPLLKDLAKRGVDVHVLTPNYGSYTEELEEKKNYTIHRFKSLRYLLYRQRKVSQQMHARTRVFHMLLHNQYVKWSAWELAREFDALHAQLGFDVVHANNIESLLALPHIKSDVPKIAHVNDVGVLSLHYFTKDGKFCDTCTAKNLALCFRTNRFAAQLMLWDIARRRWKALEHADGLIAINNHIHKLLVGRGYKNIFTIYHALDPLFVSRRTRQQERKALRIGSDNVVLYVSYLGYTKGAQYLADVALSLPDFRFVVIGTGPLEEPLRSMKLKNLTLLGHQPPKVVRRYFRASDIVLYLLTRHGGFGRIGVEAMANEVPVVAFDVRGMDDLVHKDTGVLVTLNDAKGLSKALESLMKDKSLRVRMGRKGKADVMRKFTVETAAGKLLDAYRAVSGGH